VTSVFSEPGEFQTAMSAGGCISFLFMRSGRFQARSIEVKLTHLRLLSVEESLPRVASIRVPSETILVGLAIECSVPPIWGGDSADGGELITIGAGQCAHMRTDGPCHWGTIWLPVQELSHYSRALIGTPIDVPPGVCHWRPPSGTLRRFRDLYLAAIRTTHARSGRVAGAEAAHGLEQQLIHLLVDCLCAKPPSWRGPSMHRGADLIARFDELIRSQPESDLSTLQVATALNVSDRFLRKCCARHLGMSPMSYVRLHRMQLVNHALRQGASPTVRVADVAKHFGFHNPSRFADAYRELYGELPDETLQRASRRGLPNIGPYDWVGSANRRNSS
jgi:AraC-like DNA-binding protein